jgi:ferredoxin
MVKMETPSDRRRFLKHLGILGAAGVMGMTLGEVFSPTESDLIDASANTEISNRRKIIWESKEAAEEGDTDEGTTTELKSGGFPIVNRRACAYHLPDLETGEYKEISRKNNNQFCRAPCVDVCPVDAILLRETDEGRTMPGFTKKKGDLNQDWGNDDETGKTGCIGCTKCFKMCGYDAIQWVNPEV